MPLPAGVQVQAEEVVEQCLRDTGAHKVSDRAKEVALIALLVAPTGAIFMREYRTRIKETYVRANPEVGSFFLIVILPILISLISNWIARWIWDRKDMRTIRSGAFDALTELSPGWAERHGFTSTLQKNLTESSE